MAHYDRLTALDFSFLALEKPNASLVHLIQTIVWYATPVFVIATLGGLCALGRLGRPREAGFLVCWLVVPTIALLVIGLGFTVLRWRKRVDVALEGAPWTVDDDLAPLLRDPLRHLVRNAVDHGIELPIERQAAGATEVAGIAR